MFSLHMGEWRSKSKGRATQRVKTFVQRTDILGGVEQKCKKLLGWACREWALKEADYL
jgi:hypothetical protein